MKKFIPVIAILILFTVSIYGGDSLKKADQKIPSSDEFIPVEVMPEAIKKVAPEYPAAAMKAGIEGSVVIKAFIDKTGTVKKAEVAKISKKDVGFEKAAIKAAYLCTYKPAIQNKQPVGIWVSYKVNFQLDDQDE